MGNDRKGTWSLTNVAQNSFQRLDFNGSLLSLEIKLDATIIRSKTCPILGEYISIFVTQWVTITTV